MIYTTYNHLYSANILIKLLNDDKTITWSNNFSNSIYNELKNIKIVLENDILYSLDDYEFTLLHQQIICINNMLIRWYS